MKKIFLTLGLLSVITQSCLAEAVQQKDLSKMQMQKQNRQIVELAADEINKTLPQTVDKYTTLVSVKGNETSLHYMYEINTGAKSDKTIQNEDRTRMKKAVTHGVCTSSKRFIDAQINISYIYVSAKSKVELFRFDITQADCFKIK